MKASTSRSARFRVGEQCRPFDTHDFICTQRDFQVARRLYRFDPLVIRPFFVHIDEARPVEHPLVLLVRGHDFIRIAQDMNESGMREEPVEIEPMLRELFALRPPPGFEWV